MFGVRGWDDSNKVVVGHGVGVVTVGRRPLAQVSRSNIL